MDESFDWQKSRNKHARRAVEIDVTVGDARAARQGRAPVFTTDELQGHAMDRQAELRRQAAVDGLIRRTRTGRPIRIVPSIPPRVVATAAVVFALAGTMRLER
jgi:hypothetical protein